MKEPRKNQHQAEIIDMTQEPRRRERIIEESDIDFDELRARAMGQFLDWGDGDEETAEQEVAALSHEDLLDEYGDHLPPTRGQVDKENDVLLRRQRQFRLAADYIARALAELPAVRKVVLFGSVAVPLKKEIPRFRKYARAGVALWHECNDVDLAVWLDNLDGLKALQKARGNALNALMKEHNIGVAHHQAELYIMEPGTDRYRGRLCCYGACPKGKRDCLVPGCGAQPFLQQFAGFTFHADALAPEKSVLLFERPLA